MKFSPEKTFLDHFLAMIGGMMATYSIAASINRMDLALFLSGSVLITGLLGYFLSTRFKESKAIQADGWVCAILCLTGVFFSRTINNALPEGGFPFFELFAAAVLSILVIVSNLASWRDATLLFPSLPSLALFGLVGTFDTFRPGTVMFFIFLVSIAVLYARVHQRAMMERVRRLGVDPTLMRRDRWRWMAGPEWAFAAAGFIILLSLMGAPVIQQSLSGVSGNFNVRLPDTVQRNQRPSPASTPIQAEQEIGQGPRNQSDLPVFRIRIDQPRLLRQTAYVDYTGRGWTRPFTTFSAEDVPWKRNGEFTEGRNGGVQVFPTRVPESELLKDWDEIQITIVPANAIFSNLNSPGPVVEYMGRRSDISRRPTGEVFFSEVRGQDVPIQFYSAIPTGTPTASFLPEALRFIQTDLRAAPRIPARVARLAEEITKDAKNDYEKMLAIQRYVTQNSKYNLQAAQTPANTDPVEHFLFTSKEGYCDLFASAVATMARSAGLPSRYVVGWLIQPTNRNQDGTYTVQMKDFHAWAEVYFDGHGWVQFDATEGAQDISQRTETEKPFWTQEWFQTTASMLGILVAVGIGFLVLRKVAGQFKPPANKSAIDFHRVQIQFQQILEKRYGHPRRFSQTLREFVVLATPSLGEAAPTAINLVTEFEKGLFSAEAATPEDTKAMKQKVKAFASLLKAQGAKPRG